MSDEIAAVVGAYILLYILLLAMWFVFLFAWTIAVWWSPVMDRINSRCTA